MNRLITLLVLVFSFSSMAQSEFQSFDEEYVLTPENNALSFWYQKDGKLLQKAPRYDVHILFEKKKDYFNLRKGLEHYGVIESYGEGKCNDLKIKDKSRFPTDRPYPDKYKDSLYYFTNTKAHLSLYKAKKSNYPVKEGRCYAISSINGFDKITAVFRVKKHIKGKKVVLDQIEIYQHETFPPLRNPPRRIE